MNSPPVTFPCSVCTKRMGVPAELLGRQVRCPHCKNVIVAPAPSTPPSAPQVVVGPPAPSAPATPQVVSPPPDLPAFNFPARKEGADSILGDANESEDEVFGSNPGGRVRTTPPIENPPANPASAEKPFLTSTAFDLPSNVMPPAPPAPGPVLKELPDPFGDSEPAAPYGAQARGAGPGTDGGAAPFGPQAHGAAPRPVPQPVLPTPVPVTGPTPSSPSVGGNPFGAFVSPSAPPTPDEFEDAPRPKRRRNEEEDEPDERPSRGRNKAAPKGGGGWKTLVIVLLLGYAIAATGLAVYGFFVKDMGHPLSNIPDTFGEFDPVQRKKVGRLTAPADAPLPPEQRVALNGKITVGQIEITPEKVTKRRLVIDTETDKGKKREWTPTPALVLVLDIKNRSPDLPIFPLDPAFNRRETREDRPLSRLMIGRKAHFGGEIDWPPVGETKRKLEVQQANDGVPLKPGESRQYVVFTAANGELVKEAEKATESLQWRVQVRRGLVEYKGRDVPVTAVIGVDFSASDITAG